MLKRILVDFTLLKTVYPDISCVLLQFESQLTGDYSQINNNIIYGSHSTHTLLSYFDIDLNIITLLEGERKVNQEFQKEEFRKIFTPNTFIKTVEKLQDFFDAVYKIVVTITKKNINLLSKISLKIILSKKKINLGDKKIK